MIETRGEGAPTYPPRSYTLSDYLRFGGQHGLGFPGIDYEGLRLYLLSRGFDKGGLVQTLRDGGIRERIGEFRPKGVHYCDFCGRLMTGVEFDRLKDGRERCPECTRTVLKRLEEYEELFSQVKRHMMEWFGIDFPVPITVHVVTQPRLAREFGRSFTPTSDMDQRYIGCACPKKSGMTMFFENGAPRLKLTSTSAHELTHIWQFTHWDEPSLEARYGDAYKEIVEGMAVWVEAQYLYLMNEPERADNYIRARCAETDEYGLGLKRYMKVYPFSKGIILTGKTPFMDPKNPLGK